jgi:hypothetical protein
MNTLSEYIVQNMVKYVFNDYIFIYLRYFYKIKEDNLVFSMVNMRRTAVLLVEDGGGSPSEVVSYFTKLRLCVRMQHMGSLWIDLYEMRYFTVFMKAYPEKKKV